MLLLEAIVFPGEKVASLFKAHVVQAAGLRRETADYFRVPSRGETSYSHVAEALVYSSGGLEGMAQYQVKCSASCRAILEA